MQKAAGIALAAFSLSNGLTLFVVARGEGIEKPLCRHDVAIRTTIEPKPFGRSL
jgi:hypothetical protein